jgi:metal-responsive CopG/Arc/MetJ family transcriptional regulator
MATTTPPNRHRRRGEERLRVVPTRFDPEWVPRIDAVAAARGRSRSEFIRSAVAALLAAEEGTELVS